MVGAVGLSIASSLPGGMNATTGFFLAFAATFLVGGGVLLFIRYRGTNGTPGSGQPGQETGLIPRGPIAPVAPSGSIERDKAAGQRGAERRREERTTERSI